MTRAECRPTSRKRRWLFRVAAIGVVVLLGGELMLQVAVRLSPGLRWALLPPWRQRLPEERAKLRIPRTLDDARFGCRGNSEHPDHDRWGFPNPSVPERCDIVALGDSHTYGTLLSREQAWPAVLQRLSTTNVYSMALGGWGPVEYLMLVEQALSLEPKVVLFGVYFGNDLFDCYRTVYVRGAEPRLVNPEVADELARTEAREAMQTQASRLFWIPEHSTPPEAGEGGLSKARFWVAQHCQLYAVARLLKHACSPSQARAAAFANDSEAAWQYALRWAADHKEYCTIMDLGSVRTVLTAPYRHVALNLDDPRIEEGLNLARKALGIAAEKCRAHSVQPVVVLLPTKELVFSVLVPEGTRGESLREDVRSSYPGLAKLVSAELAVRALLTAHLDEQGIAWMDPLPALRACFDTPGQQPYPASMDGHPNAVGQRAIAQAVRAALPAVRTEPSAGRTD